MINAILILFEIGNPFGRYPEIEQLVHQLKTHTGLDVNHIAGEFSRRNEAGEPEKYTLHLVSAEKEVKEGFAIEKLGQNRLVITKNDENFTYLFHALMYLLARHTATAGGGMVVSQNGAHARIAPNDDLADFYPQLGFYSINLEAAQHPYQTAKDMEGFIHKHPEEEV